MRPTIAFLVDRILGTSGYQSEVWRGIVEAARNHDANLICYTGGCLKATMKFDEYEFQRNIIYDLIPRDHVNGLIIGAGVIGQHINLEELTTFCHRYLPLPTINIGLEAEGIPSLLVNDTTGMREAIVHLIKKHDRSKIAFIRGPEGSVEAQRRYQTYLDTLKAYGIPANPELVTQGDFFRDSGIEAARTLLDERKVEFDALIGANDVMALAAMEVIQLHGFDVPHDISIIGFDDVVDANVSNPPLTTIRQPMYEIGKRAVEFLITILEGGQVPDCETMPTTLVKRMSCGCDTIPESENLPVEEMADPVSGDITTQRDQIIKNVVKAYDPSYSQEALVTEHTSELVDTYLNVITHQNDTDELMAVLEKILRHAMIHGADAYQWQYALSALSELTLSLSEDIGSIKQVAKIWQRASLLLGRMGLLSISYTKLQDEHRAEPLRYANQALLTTFDIHELLETMWKRFPNIGIYSCVLSLFDSPELSSGNAKLMLSYNTDGRRDIEEETQYYPAIQLVPDGFLDDQHRYELVVNSLYFREKIFGFVVFGMENLDTEMCETMATQISTAIQGANAFKELREADQEIRRQSVQVEALNTIISAAATEEDIKRLLETALDHTLRAVGLEIGSIWIPPEIVTRGLPEGIIDSVTRDILTHAEIQITNPITIEDWSVELDNETLTPISKIFTRHGVGASLVAPIRAEDGNLIGGLILSATQPRSWSKEEIDLVIAVGQQLGTAAQRLRLLEQIREQMLQVQQIIDTVPEGVVLFDNDGLILLANPAGENDLHLLAEANIGDTLTILGNRPLSDLIDRDRKKPWCRISYKNRIFEAIVKPLEKGMGSEGWVLVLRDVTQEHETQKRIQQQERLAAVGQMAGGIAHDFNNMLTTIMLYAQRPLRKHELNEDLKKSLNTILKESKQAANLVQQILDFSRRSPIETSPVDLGPFIKETVRVLQRTIPENISLYMEIDPEAYVVESDPTRIQQVLMNLVVNARDAMPEGGTLRIKLSKVQVAESDDPPVVGMVPGDWFCLSVSDTGTGIRQEILPHIFEPFFTTKETGKGTGLGLAQVYGIVRQHKGQISVETEIDIGSTFRVYLPMCEVEKEPLAQDGIFATIPQGKGETILLVEDNEKMREVGQHILEDLGYQVLAAANGREALEIYKTNGDIDLLFTDVVMPEVGGAALLRELRQMGSEVKAVAVTGHIIAEDMDHLKQAGVASVIHKPYDVDILADVIREALDNE
jgi:signal transduction histidine kinase/DNA-binding LacI/PurR family transcriptional regulator/ActR/RegA family two-component response regulator